MQKKPLLVAFLVVVVTQLGWLCGPLGIEILAPERRVEDFSFEVSFEITGEIEAGSLEVTINGESILDRISGGPLYTATIDPGPPLRNQNLLVVKAVAASNGQPATRVRPFRYKPPGKAVAKRITRSKDLIRGPLANSRIGDWLLANGEARFVIQDVGQRDLYSVGQYGGNIIDAEVVGRPGLDNFLEVQAGLNIETVVNAQTVEIVNDGQDGTAAILRSRRSARLRQPVEPGERCRHPRHRVPRLCRRQRPRDRGLHGVRPRAGQEPSAHGHRGVQQLRRRRPSAGDRGSAAAGRR
jgi:hypothetical protein